MTSLAAPTGQEVSVLLSKVAFTTGAVSSLLFNVNSGMSALILILGSVYCYYLCFATFVSLITH